MVISKLSNKDKYKQALASCLYNDQTSYVLSHYKFGLNFDSGLDLLLTTMSSDTVLYKIRDENGIAAVFGVEKEINVHPLFIEKNHRNKEVVAKVWNALCSCVKKEFYMLVYETNLPGIKFYEKNNGKLVGNKTKFNQNILIYKFDQGSL